MKPLLPCEFCSAPVPDLPIFTRVQMGGAIYFRCPGCGTERAIPWGVCDREIIERARKAVGMK